MTTASMIFRGDATSVERAAGVSVASVARVERSAKGAGKQLQVATVHADKFGHSLKHIAGLTIGTLGLHELVHGLREAVNAAGDVEKQQSKVIRVFGATPKVLQAFEKSSAKAYGISHLAALKAASSTGALLTNLGVGPKYAAGLSVGIQKLSADIASFNDLPTARVAQSVNNALLGQTRGLKALGINLSAADVKAKAFAIGLVRPKRSADEVRAAQDRVTVSMQKYGIAVRDHGKNSKEALSAEAALIASNKGLDKARAGTTAKLTAQQTALATYALILERSKKQQGDFARNQDKIANSSKVLDAEFADLSDRAGNALEPSVKALIEFMAGPGIAGANAFLTGFGRDATQLYDAVKPLAPVAHAAGEGLRSILSVQGLVPTLLGAAGAFKGVTLAAQAGSSVYASAAGLIGNLTSPFKLVSSESRAAGTALAVFGTEAVAADAAAVGAEAGFLGLANPIAAIATVAGLAVGGLILLSSTSESAGQKARKARDDFLGLADAVNRVKSTKLDVKQAGLDVLTAQQAVKKFSPTLISAREGAHQAFPDTPAGDRASAAAKQKLSDALLRNKQLYIDLARAKERKASADAAEAKSEADHKRKLDDTVNAFDGLEKALVSSGNLQNVFAVRSGHAEKTISAQARAAAAVAKTMDGWTAAAKGLSPAQRAAVGQIRDFIKQADKVPTKKEMKILLNDAATGKIKALQRELDRLQGKTLTINEVTQTSRRLSANRGTGKAAGDIIDRPMVAMIGEEAPAHPEFIIPTNPARRGRALGLISQMRSWIPGFDNGGGPSDRVRRQETAAVANTPAKTAKSTSKSSKSSKSSKPKDNRPPWLKTFEDGGNKLPGDDAFANAVARAQADLDDATRTPAKTDDIAALHHLMRLANKRLPVLHALRNKHKEAVWQTAVNTQISSVTGQATGYRSNLTDLLHKPGPDDVQIQIPSGINWAIEKAGFTDDFGDDVKAYNRKAFWLQSQIAKTPPGAKRTALKRELARTNNELAALNVAGFQAAQENAQAAQQARQDAQQAAETPPDVPLSIQEQLADAALTPDTGDDLVGLQAEQAFLQQAIANEANPTARIALKQALAGVNDQIAGLTSSGGTTAPSDDDQAVLAQTQARLAEATRHAALSDAAAAVFGSSGDIGTGQFANAFDAGRGAPVLYWGAPATTTQVASAAAQGFGNQPAVQSNRQRIAI